MPERDAITCNLGDGYLLLDCRRPASGEVGRAERGPHAPERTICTPIGERSTPWMVADRGPRQPTRRCRRPTGHPPNAWKECCRSVLREALAICKRTPRSQASRPPSSTWSRISWATWRLTSPRRWSCSTIRAAMPSPRSRLATTARPGRCTQGFRQWMARRYHEKQGKTPNAQALVDATNVLAGKALFDSPEVTVHLRMAEQDGVIYLDLCNERWEVVVVDRDGWRVTAQVPVKFRRTKGMLPLPIPAAGGDLRGLRGFINVPGADAGTRRRGSSSWRGSLRRFGRAAYPVLVTIGGQGRAKSTLQRMLRALLDPNKAAIRTLPRRDGRDLMIAATNSWCAAFDNVSHLQDWQSDALCRLSTGGGFATRSCTATWMRRSWTRNAR